jgi:hypothetical protein
VAGFLALSIVLLVVLKTTGSALAARALGRVLDHRYVVDVGLMWMLQVALLPVGSVSFLRGLFLRRGTFVRTAKKGV